MNATPLEETASNEPADTEPTRLCWSALWRGAVSTITFALPISIAQIFLIETDEISKSDPINFLLYLAIMFTGALGGYAAAKLSPSSPLQNGAAAAALAAFVIQLGGAVRRAIAGETISSPLGWIFLALLMATMGMFGAWVHIKTDPPGLSATRSGLDDRSTTP